MRPVAAPFIDWLYSGLCWQLLNCSHLLCFALKPNKSPNRIDLLTLTQGSVSFSWLIWREWLCVFTVCCFRAHAPVCFWIPWSIAVWFTHQPTKHSVHYFCFSNGLNWDISWLCFSVRCQYIASNYSSTFCRDTVRCGYWLQAECYFTALYYSNGLLFWR